ncbi:hypothetical protein GCM10008949_32930 [Deinococcus humi]|nr:hypothetical protein GCM10008949_32930 [Deinococcus humi]
MLVLSQAAYKNASPDRLLLAINQNDVSLLPASYLCPDNFERSMLVHCLDLENIQSSFPEIPGCVNPACSWFMKQKALVNCATFRSRKVWSVAVTVCWSWAAAEAPSERAAMG